MRRGERQLVGEDMSNVPGSIGPPLGWHCVRTEERGPHGQTDLRRSLPRDSQDPYFGLGVQPVAALDLHCRRAACGHRTEPLHSQGPQSLVRCRAGRANGRQDAATGLQDGGVVGAREPLLELAGATACPHGVCVAVDQARQHQASRRVDLVVGRGCLRIWTDPCHPPVAHGYRDAATDTESPSA